MIPEQNDARAKELDRLVKDIITPGPYEQFKKEIDFNLAKNMNRIWGNGAAELVKNKPSWFRVFKRYRRNKIIKNTVIESYPENWDYSNNTIKCDFVYRVRKRSRDEK